jgi:hypothetical protein
MSSAAESTLDCMSRRVAAAVCVIRLLGVAIHLRGRGAFDLLMSLRVWLAGGELITLADYLVRLVVIARVLAVESIRPKEDLVSALIIVRGITSIGMLLWVVLSCHM